MNHKWKNRAIAHPDHNAELEAAAADHEFGASKMPREQAEEAAYSLYKQKQHMAAAGHHLRNLRLAVANGERKDGEKHNTLYGLHMRALGLRPSDPPPSGVSDAASKPMTEKAHRFTNHPADMLLVGGPMSKSSRDAIGFYHLSKADNGTDGSIQKPQDPSSMSEAGSTAEATAPPAPQAAPTMALPKVGIGGNHKEAGPQHFDKGSLVRYRNLHGDNYVPPDWVGTVTAHHVIKVHSHYSPGRKHYYELLWRTSEGKQVEDFLQQDELTPYKSHR